MRAGTTETSFIHSLYVCLSQSQIHNVWKFDRQTKKKKNMFSGKAKKMGVECFRLLFDRFSPSLSQAYIHQYLPTELRFAIHAEFQSPSDSHSSLVRCPPNPTTPTGIETRTSNLTCEDAKANTNPLPTEDCVLDEDINVDTYNGETLFWDLVFLENGRHKIIPIDLDKANESNENRWGVREELCDEPQPESVLNGGNDCVEAVDLSMAKNTQMTKSMALSRAMRFTIHLDQICNSSSRDDNAVAEISGVEISQRWTKGIVMLTDRLMRLSLIS
ncbi:hypothetical protein ACLOJK_016364 [Asimina triloba]